MILFFDHLVNLTEVESKLRGVPTSEEKLELWNLIDEIVHNRVISLILDRLPNEDHNEFLEKYHKAPYDVEIIEYINLRVDGDISEHIIKEVNLLKAEMLKLIDE